MFYLPIMLTGSMLFRKAMKFHAGLQRERKSAHASGAGIRITYLEKNMNFTAYKSLSI